MSRKQKKYLTEAVILVVIFIAAVNVFGYFTNRGKDNMTADMGAATYPQLSVSYNGYTINKMPGYKQEMDIASLRDVITPVANGQIDLEIQHYDNKISSIECGIYTLDGKEKLLDKKVEEPGESVTIDLEGTSVLSEERSLQIVVNLSGKEKVYYYTRLVDAGGKNVQECLNYIKNFHENALDKVEGAGVGKALEPDETGDSSSLQHVTIHSDYDHVTWGELNPSVEGSEIWQIKEINGTSISVQLQYQVRCKGEENEEDVYKVKEFFRVRYESGSKEGLLLDYDRTMEQVFDATRKVIGEKGLILGIADPDVSYVTSSDGKKTAFVQAGELWHYSKESDHLSLVFSFASAENTDERNRTSQYQIEPLEMDKAGNVSFAVYGYMNRGDHEGEVGVALYYYDAAENSVEERVFLSTRKSYGNAILELGKLVYYNEDTNKMYALVDEVLYEIDVEKGRETELVTGLQDGTYVVSKDRELIAFQTSSQEGGEEGNSAQDAAVQQTEIEIRNLAAETTRTVKSEGTQMIKPLGFMNHDFVYGVSKEEDAGEAVSGETIVPMYKIEIQNSKGKIVKTYEEKDVYITNTEFKDNMIILSRATQKGTVYNSIIEDYITNNEGEKESNIEAETYTTQLKQRQVRIAYRDGIENREPQVLKPRQIKVEKPAVFSFDETSEQNSNYYVYGYGELQGIYNHAGEAIQQADLYSGVVVSASQEYIWERGNRDLQYSIDAEAEVLKTIREKLNSGMAPVEAAAETHDGKSLDLTGCTPEELMYIINQDRPVIAMKSQDTAVILVGYTESTMTYMDIDSGERHTVPVEEMEEMTYIA